jgi:hypothetical protein
MPGNNQEESIRHSKHGINLKSKSCKYSYVGSSQEQLTEQTTPHDKTNMLQNAALCYKRKLTFKLKLFTSVEKEHFDTVCLKTLSYHLL